MFTRQDHDELLLATDLMSWASQLINGVMDRRRLDLNSQAILCLCEAKHDADLGARQTGMADKYLGVATCYCCTCTRSDYDDSVTSWDPACHNHGAHGVRGCETHGVPAQDCDCGCEEKTA